MTGVVVLGVLVSFAAFFLARSMRRTERIHQLERRATAITYAIEQGFDAPLEVLHSVSSLFEASRHVSRAEFRAFVRASLERFPFIYALEWIPRVPHAERAAYEAAAIAEGLDGFRFTEDLPDGRIVVAGEREEYFPLYYMEPPNRTALGIEETALAARREALDRARDSGRIALTERLRLVQDQESIVSVIAFSPLYETPTPDTVEARQQELRGYLAAVLRVRPVVERALRGTPQDVDMALLDEGHIDPSKRLLFESRPGVAQSREGLGWSRRLNLGGRTWSVVVRDATAMRAEGWPALAGGLVLTLLCAVLIASGDTIRGLRRQVSAARKLGQYTLGEKLGEGGMGVVYEARHALLRRPTAIKLLSPERSDAAAFARFEREAQLTSSLTHPNTVVIYDYGRTPEGAFYYAMEYIDGLNLDELTRAERIPLPRAIHLLDQLCASLSEAHGIGLVHRDIKPANVMVCSRGGVPDFVKVLDFGLAKEQRGAVELSSSGARTFFGTPLYAAPEIIVSSAEVDGRADIYSVGALACFLFTGEPPFSGENMVEVCTRHLAVPAEPPSTLTDRPIPPELDALVLRCLEKKPEDRFASMDELRAALAAVPLPKWTQVEASQWWAQCGQTLVRTARERARQARVAEPTVPIVIDPVKRVASSTTRG